MATRATKTRAKSGSRAKAAVKRAVKKLTRSPGKKKAPAAKKKPAPFASLKKQDLTVEQYITHAEVPWRAVMAELRMTVKTACPEASEVIKWGQPVFECNGPLAWMKAFGKHVSLGFFRGGELNDPDKVLEGSGARMRHVKITDPEDVPIAKIDALVRQAADLNRTKPLSHKSGRR